MIQIGDLMNDSKYFRWNMGGWFGTLIGGTAWLLLSGVVIIPRAAGIAIVWFVCFAVTNAVGWLMWRQRHRLRPYTAIQLLLVACGLCGLTAWSTLAIARPDVMHALGWSRLYLGLLTVPALMVWFAILEHNAGKRAQALDKSRG